MYDQEKIKKMKNHELAMEAYYYSINNKLIGGISEKNAVKCFEQIIAMLNSDERLNLPFINDNLNMYINDHLRMYTSDYALI